MQAPTSNSAIFSTALLAITAIALLATGRRGVRGTTLVAPWLWSGGAIAFVALAELAAGQGSLSHGSDAPRAWRFAAAMSTFLPAMALLGAKRPQDRAWQMIVFSLWVILSMPAAEWLLLETAATFELHPARRWFMVVLWIVPTINYLPTRFWFSNLLASAGQFVLLHDFLFPGLLPASVNERLAFTALVTAALAWARFLSPSQAGVSPLDRVWLDFRDAFGAAWGLRVMERMNSASETCSRNARLAWQGFVFPADAEHAASAEEQPLRDGFQPLLRRFVSSEWLAARWGAAGGGDSPLARRFDGKEDDD